MFKPDKFLDSHRPQLASGGSECRHGRWSNALYLSKH
jgi:hypothetical protein